MWGLADGLVQHNFKGFELNAEATEGSESQIQKCLLHHDKEDERLAKDIREQGDHACILEKFLLNSKGTHWNDSKERHYFEGFHSNPGTKQNTKASMAGMLRRRHG